MATIQPIATVARSHLSPDGGSLPRAPPPLGSGWLRFNPSPPSPVATCRQTVEASLAPHHRLAADGYDSPVARSHLSPDGGSLPRHAYHRLAADGYYSRGLLPISRSQLPLPFGTLIRLSSLWDYAVSFESVFSPIRSNKKRATQWSPVSFWTNSCNLTVELSLELASSAISHS